MNTEEFDIKFIPNFEKINEPLNKKATIICQFESQGETELQCNISDKAKILKIDESGWW